MIIERKEPWICEGANEWLEKYFKSHPSKSLNILEFGMGASTIWFVKQPACLALISVEHDDEWFAAVRGNMPYPLDPFFCAIKKSQPYHEVVAVVPEIRNREFDVILVDGRNRVKCINSSMQKLKSGGILILDNSEREYYEQGIELMKNWKKITFLQPYPDKYGFTYPGWSTTIFFKP